MRDSILALVQPEKMEADKAKMIDVLNNWKPGRELKSP